MPSPAVKRILFGGPNYIGPGDIIPGAMAWRGLRAYNRAYAKRQGNCVDVVRASDGASMPIRVLPNGRIDAGNAAAFLMGTTGKISKLYDQTDNGYDLTQTTDAARPALTLMGLNGLPVMTFAGAEYLGRSAAPPVVVPWSISTVAKRTGNFTVDHGVLGAAGPGPSRIEIGFVASGFSANSAALNIGSDFVLNANSPDDVWHAMAGTAASGAGAIYVDGTSAGTGSTGQDWDTANAEHFGADVFLGRYLVGEAVEGGVWSNKAFSAEEVAALRANKQAHWRSI